MLQRVPREGHMSRYVWLTVAFLFGYLGGILDERRYVAVDNAGVSSVVGVVEPTQRTTQPARVGHGGNGTAQPPRQEVQPPERWPNPGKVRIRNVERSEVRW